MDMTMQGRHGPGSGRGGDTAGYFSKKRKVLQDIALEKMYVLFR